MADYRLYTVSLSLPRMEDMEPRRECPECGGAVFPEPPGWVCMECSEWCAQPWGEEGEGDE